MTSPRGGIVGLPQSAAVGSSGARDAIHMSEKSLILTLDRVGVGIQFRENGAKGMQCFALWARLPLSISSNRTRRSLKEKSVQVAETTLDKIGRAAQKIPSRCGFIARSGENSTSPWGVHTPFSQ